MHEWSRRYGPAYPTFPPDSRADEGHRLAFGPAAQSASPITDALASKAEDWPPNAGSEGMVLAIGFGMIFFIQLAGNSSQIFISEVFPTNARASGFGLCQAAGRVGALWRSRPSCGSSRASA